MCQSDEMCQSDNELSRYRALFGGCQIGSDWMAWLGRQSFPSPICGWNVAFLEQREEQFKSIALITRPLTVVPPRLAWPADSIQTILIPTRTG